MTDAQHPAATPLPPGQFGLPWIGETLSFVLDRDFANKRQAKYGPIFKTRILGRPTVVMVGPEANRFLLSTHMHCFSWRDGWPANFRELLGESLFLQEGEEHDRNRKLLMPAFHGKALESYFATMEHTTQTYLDRWEALGTFAWFDEMKELTFEIASVLLLGNDSGEMTPRLSQWFSELSAGLFAAPVRWPWTTYGKALAARNQLLNHVEQVIHQRQEHPGRDALSLLLQSRDEAGDRLSFEEIRVQALLMLFAGHETTTSMVTSLCMALGQHPDVLAQARAEQDGLAAEGPLALDQLKRMPYLEQIIQEVERVYPPIGGGFRGVIQPFEFNGYRVPAGWMALYRIDATHRDPRCYPDAERFDPDRFSPDRAENKTLPFSLVGFGGGPRICLGLAFAQMEMKVIVAHLLRHYTWELLPDQDLTLNPIPTLRPKSGLKIKFQRR